MGRGIPSRSLGARPDKLFQGCHPSVIGGDFPFERYGSGLTAFLELWEFVDLSEAGQYPSLESLPVLEGLADSLMPTDEEFKYSRGPPH